MTKAVSSFFLLSVLVTGMVAIAPSAFADVHPILTPVEGSGVPGCQDTEELCYNMPILTVSPGTEITFDNTDNVAHTLTSGSPTDGATGVFDSSLVLAGSSYVFTIDEEGTYDHYCLVHPWMTGQIIVSASADPHSDNDSDMMVDDSDMMVDDSDMMVDDSDMMVDDSDMMVDDSDMMVDDSDMMVDDSDMMVDDSDMMVDDSDMMMDDPPVDDTTGDDGNGGCLIATAAFGSELAPQVQQLRELRDNTVLATESGTAFMSGFNQVYYAFSPAVADLERENPMFREVVQVTLTPMLSSLSLLNYAEIDSESEMLGYGISVILLNLGMYVGAPAFAILTCTKLVRARLHNGKLQNR